MKVAFLTASVSRNAGGLFISVRRLAQELLHSGLEVEVLSLRDRFTDEDAPAWKPVPVRCFASKGPASYGYSPALRNALRECSADLLHAQGLWMYPSTAGRCWGRKTGKPYLITPRGMLDPWALANSRWKKILAGRLFENRNLREAACIHALCESEAQSIRRYGLRNLVCVIPNGMDLPEKPATWEERKPELLFLGRIHPKKGLQNLVSAWALARARLAKAKDWKLRIAGWDQDGHQAELEKQVRDLGLGSAVEFAGPLFGERKDAALRSASAFVLPSFSEGLPMAVLEAWAYALPVVMTAECNVPEGFAAQAAVRIASETGSIAEGLVRMLEITDAQRAAMGERGRRLIQERFAWPHLAEQMKEVYSYLLNGGSPPSAITNC